MLDLLILNSVSALEKEKKKKAIYQQRDKTQLLIWFEILRSPAVHRPVIQESCSSL